MERYCNIAAVVANEALVHQAMVKCMKLNSTERMNLEWQKEALERLSG